MTFVFRDAVQSDATAIAGIFNEQVLSSSFVYTVDPVTIESREELIKERGRQGFPFVVAECDNVVVAYATYGSFRAATGYRHTVEHSIYVHHDYRGKGLGRMLLEMLIATARCHDVHVMVAGVDSENKKSIQLHQKFDFDFVAHMPQVGLKFGEWRTLVLMQRIIK